LQFIINIFVFRADTFRRDSNGIVILFVFFEFVGEAFVISFVGNAVTVKGRLSTLAIFAATPIRAWRITYDSHLVR
jgi:hypothetical protein